MRLIGCALAAAVWTEAGVAALQGARLDEFVLQERVGRANALARPGLFPEGLRRTFPDAAYLRSGSFGEAWRASRTVDGEQVSVVLKLFYRKPDSSYGRVTYLTKANLRPAERKAVQEATQECVL